MKKFILKTIVLAIIVIGIDFLVGKTCSFMMTHVVGGDTKRMNTIADELKDDFVIFGSSRAIHHYDPLIIQDSLGMDCYNAGRNGNGIIFSYGQYKLLSSRYHPRIIIYDVEINFDLTDDDKTKYLDWLKRYYERPGIDSIFWSVDKTMRFKMLSQMYRYNGTIISFASDCVNPMQDDIKGYRPLDGEMKYEPMAKANDEKENEIVYDSLKLAYWQRLVTDCKNSGTTLVFALSPLYKAKPQDAEKFRLLIDMAKKNGIPFINHYADTTYSTKREYFEDSYHMNRQGATAYTKAVIKEIREILQH